MHTSVCMYALVYEYLTHVCAYMCMYTHVYMYFWQNPPLSIEVGRAGFAPPPNIENLPTPVIWTCILIAHAYMNIVSETLCIYFLTCPPSLDTNQPEHSPKAWL